MMISNMIILGMSVRKTARHTYMLESFTLKSKQRPPAYLEMKASAFFAFPWFVFADTLFSFIRSDNQCSDELVIN